MDESLSFLPSTYQLGDLNAMSTNGAGAAPTPYGQGFGEAFLSQMGAIAGGYLNRRMDIDLASRWQSVGTVGRNGMQNGIASTPQTGLVVASNGTVAVSLPRLMPLLMLGALVFLALR